MVIKSGHVPSAKLHNKLVQRKRGRRRPGMQAPKVSRVRANPLQKYPKTGPHPHKKGDFESSSEEDEATPQKMDLEIRPVKTSKDKIRQPPLAKHELMYIPPVGSSVLICGKSGCGKSTLLQNLLTEKRFYKGYFDKTFLISPTANGDDVQRQIGVEKEHVFTDLEEAPEVIETILNAQQKKLDNSSADKVPQYCLIFDDVIGDTKFMNEKAFTRCFYQVRHVNCTTFICTQHFKRVPRVCRLQANFIFFFEGSQTEVDTVAEEFAPPNVHPNTFKQLVNEATKEDYSFLTINMKVPPRIRFRRQLEHIIDLENYVDNNKLEQAPGDDVRRETPFNASEERSDHEAGEEAAERRHVPPHR